MTTEISGHSVPCPFDISLSSIQAFPDFRARQMTDVPRLKLRPVPARSFASCFRQYATSSSFHQSQEKHLQGPEGRTSGRPCPSYREWSFLLKDRAKNESRLI